MRFVKSGAILGAIVVIVLVAFLLRAAGVAEKPAASQREAPVAMAAAPTFVELGSDRCTSCRAMIPVLEELRGAHGCHLNVQFIDVWDDPKGGERFDVVAIPTQVLLAPDGREIARHTGFWSADAIRVAFASHGIALESEQGSCAP